MTEKILKHMYKIISFIPGLIGLAPIDFSKKSALLTNDNYGKSFLFEETSKGLNVSVAILATTNVRTEVVVSEIESSLREIAKKDGFKLGKILVYVRGIQ